ncbi:MAG TPA: hypothetical protein VNR59_12600 [Gaiellaceae bacterium]|nr:hypothetical protein [Gaiellaceae bacterium]
MISLLVGLTLLHGTVRIGPTSPVCRAGVPCTKPAARVVLTFTQRGARVRVKTDTKGRYHVSIRPGAWAVRANVGMRITAARFVVPRAASATRNFTIDTGIR